MNLLFDSSVWVEHLRRGALEGVVPRLRGRFVIWMDAVVAAELMAGCRSKRELRVVQRLRAPFERADRLVTPARSEYDRAALALGRLRARGRTLSNPGGALLDGLIASVAVRLGAMLVTCSVRDFQMLQEALPVRLSSFDDFVGEYAS